MKKLDLVGQKFGRLTVVKTTGKDKQGNYVWLCQCDCGNITKVRGYILKIGNTKSCGCLRKDIMTKKFRTHGMAKTTEYKSWANMKNRCLNKNLDCYKYYGGRGIKVCDEWKNSFETFYKDMGDKPKGTNIDRIDNNGNYCKENCRWATRKEQMRNTRRNKMITYRKETMSLAEWAERLSINYPMLWQRLKRGWSIEKTFNN